MNDTFVEAVEVLPFDAVAAAVFGPICVALESKGAPIGTMDTLIAAHAMSLNLALVFKQVRGLKIVNWLHGAG